MLLTHICSNDMNIGGVTIQRSMLIISPGFDWLGRIMDLVLSTCLDTNLTTLRFRRLARPGLIFPILSRISAGVRLTSGLEMGWEASVELGMSVMDSSLVLLDLWNKLSLGKLTPPMFTSSLTELSA